MAKRKPRRTAIPASPTPAPTSSGRVGVFISWSGDRSKALATALRDWIPLVLQDVEPFMSAVDIASGIDWWGEIGSNLSAMSVGILCLTPENLRSEWVHFEAGAIAKSANSRPIPYLLDLNPAEVPKPLGMFQAEKADQVGTGRLLASLNTMRPVAFPSDQLGRLLEKWWPELGEAIEAIPEAAAEPVRRKSEDMLEELVLGMRVIQSWIGERARPLSPESVANILAQVAERDRHAHSQRISIPHIAGMSIVSPPTVERHTNDDSGSM